LQRILSTAVIVGLLAATAAAFAITERLKLTKSPITGTKVTSGYLSPAAHTTAAVDVRFRRADLVTATVVDSGRHAVDTLVYRVRMPRGRHTFTWNGRTDAATVAPDGTYRFEIHLSNQRRTILLPNPIVLETKPPAVLDAGAVRPKFSPDGDHQSDTVTIHYKLSEDAHALVYVDGQQIIKSRSHKQKDKVSWGGTLRGKLLLPGRYVLTVGAVDLAGNKAVKLQHVAVVLRYITLAAKHETAKPGSLLRIGVSTDAKRYRWSFAGRKGFSTARTLKLRVPSRRGSFVLTVTEGRHSDRATVTVR
jgi:hypothetical protein